MDRTFSLKLHNFVPGYDLYIFTGHVLERQVQLHKLYTEHVIHHQNAEEKEDLMMEIALLDLVCAVPFLFPVVDHLCPIIALTFKILRIRPLTPPLEVVNILLIL